MTQFPAFPISASQFNDTLTITDVQQAGQYFIIQNLAVGRNYAFSSSNPEDFITIRDKDGIDVLAFGTGPVSVNVNGDDIMSIHINTTVGCGTDAIERTTFAVCTDCTDVPGRFGIAAQTPIATLEVEGGVRVGNITRPPEAGMIRWNEEAADFEGFDGQKWRSFTKSQGGWGIDANPNAFENQKLNSATPFADTIPLAFPIAISGDYLVLGMYDFGPSTPVEIQTAFVFEKINGEWTEVFEINASDTIQQDTCCSFFGRSVAIFGDRIIIGAPTESIDGDNQGAAYIYKRSGSEWLLEEKLTAFDGDTLDWFGHRVTISNDIAVVSAYRDNIGSTIDQGSVYVYKRSGTDWIFQTKIISSNPQAYALFGSDVSIDNDWLVVGASDEHVNTNEDQGRAYFYLRQPNDSWVQQATVTSSNGIDGAQFGYGVDISGSLAIIGAPRQIVESFTGAGAAYLFRKNGLNWNEEQILELENPGIGDNFGQFVDVENNVAVTSAFRKDVNNNNFYGSAYVYHFESGIWQLQKTLLPSDGRPFTQLGFWLDLDGENLGVSATQQAYSTGTNLTQRNVYIFKKE